MYFTLRLTTFQLESNITHKAEDKGRSMADENAL